MLAPSAPWFLYINDDEWSNARCHAIDCTLRIVALTGCFAIGGLTSAEREPRESNSQIRIMPIGDSITEAEAGHASYRYWLWKRFEGAGIDVDFVGSRHGVHRGRARFADFDQDHEAYWGWKADQLLAKVRVSARIPQTRCRAVTPRYQ